MSDVRQVKLHETAEERYLNYAMSVITSRALPDVRDGLKPVQRRILYSMHENLNLGSDAKPRKSAAIVGDVMGKYHPHGDQSIYDAMVRMAQPFAMRNRLVDGHGNFGSLDGDSAAAMRYTEARLTQFASELLDEIDKDTVDFRDNYDGTEREPTVLPAQVPNLLVNGATGIAVGMATSIPPHNLGECLEALIEMIDHPGMEVDDLVPEFIEGPDFPTGGKVLNSTQDLREIYRDGSGTIELRGEWEAESKTRIAITSVPYMVNKAKIVEKIADHIVKGNLPQVKDVRDESAGDVRIVLELKRQTDHETVMAYLFKHTKLEHRFRVNLTCLVPPEDTLSVREKHPEVWEKIEDLRVEPATSEDAEGVEVLDLLEDLDDLSIQREPAPVLHPARLDLAEALEHFLDFRMEVLVRRLLYDLTKLLGRIHILEAFEIIFDDLDTAIELIRSSESRQDAAEKLKAEFDIDDDQADAILETKLYRLARLEIENIREELQEKRQEAIRIQDLLTDANRRWNSIQKDLRFLLDHYREMDPRRTQTETEIVEVDYAEEDYIIEEDVWVMVSRDGWIKRQKSYTDVSKIRVRDNDSIGWVLAGRTPETAMFFTNMGRVYTMRIDEVPDTTGHGEPLQAFFDFDDGERIVGALTKDDRVLEGAPTEKGGEDERPQVVAITEGGRSVRVALEDFLEPSTVRGRMFMRLEEGDRTVNVEQFDGDQYVALASRDGRGLMFDAWEVNFYKGRAKGVKAIDLEEDDEVLDFTLVPRSKALAGLEVETNNGREEVIRRTKSKFEPTSRGNKGHLIIRRGHLIRSHRPTVEIPAEEEQEDSSD
ncbi:MAG: DNA topoisomerase (ATP-hydrolyzing) subunit A [Bradymonadaceae bacterium]